MNAGELDGLIIAEDGRNDFTKAVVQACKFYAISQVGVANVTHPNPANPIYWLDQDKIFLPYIESDITDRCNLNCCGCCHFANFHDKDEFYPFENFSRDIERIANTCDVLIVKLLGGEPLLLKNFSEYLSFVSQVLPNAGLEIFTNGLLIPSLPQKTINIIRETRCLVNISAYPPTRKIFDAIKSRLDKNSIPFTVKPVEAFAAQMTLNAGNDPVKARAACRCGVCRSIRNGKLYKCPIDAACYKFARKFGLKNYPESTGIDIYSPNFASMLQMLDGNVELCSWCSEQPRQIPWKSSNKLKLEDWLADPNEAKHLSKKP